MHEIDGAADENRSILGEHISRDSSGRFGKQIDQATHTLQLNRSSSGVSMREFLEGQSDRPRSAEQWVALELFGNSYVIAGDFKAIRVRTGMYGDGAWHLYNIKKDPGETPPLETNNEEKLKELITIYEQYAEEKGIVPVAENWNPWHGSVDEQ